MQKWWGGLDSDSGRKLTSLCGIGQLQDVKRASEYLYATIGVRPRLAIISTGDDPASQAYERPADCFPFVSELWADIYVRRS